jgi:endogenous inhibitor of DNA gyrase (YacG/DUF329 family)
MKDRCPICHKAVRTPAKEPSEEAEFFPFCSERCRLIDLGAWLDAKYKIASAQQPEESENPSDATAPSNG